MKFRTRLQVTFITIILLPMVLTSFAFIGIGIYLMNSQWGFPIQDLDYSQMSDSMDSFVEATDRVYGLLLQQTREDVSKLEDLSYLEEINRLTRRSTYILVRKDDEIYYSGNEAASEVIFDKLPAYGEREIPEGFSYYNDNMRKFVRQIDFVFSDGSKGSAFVITMVNTLISKDFLVYMFIAILAILIFTSITLTKWIQKGVFIPIDNLNLALLKIKEGNFDYALQTDTKGEIGDLYRNYEEMRLRLKESTEDEERQEQQNRELISNISHDLKTPITAIKGYVEGIMDGVADTPEKMDRYLKTISAKAEDMQRLINELTVYSNVENNRIPYNFRRINLSDYFDDCVEEVGLDLDNLHIKLNYTNMVSPDTMVIADPEQLKKVINNIINNSVKYMDKSEGVINIRILDEVDSVHVEIEDNGRGIPQKDLPRIFERFFRSDSSRNTAQGGSGIGLSIVRKIIEDHGGYVWATSKEGDGTCIHFVIRKYKELQE